MPSSGASQLTRSTRFEAMRMLPPSDRQRDETTVPPNSRCSLRRNSISTNFDRTRVVAASRIVLDCHVGDDAARSRPRLLRVDPRARQAAHARFQELAVVVDQRYGFERIGLPGLARDPVGRLRRKQRQPFVEPGFIEQPRLVEQELLARVNVETLPRPRPGMCSRRGRSLRPVHADRLSSCASCVPVPAPAI